MDSYSSLADSDLVAAYCQRGDQHAFTELVQRHRERVFRVALSVLGPGFSGEAEDVAQEVFLLVHHALASFRGEGQFSSWIYRIALNQAINLKERVRYRSPHLGEQTLAATPSPDADPLKQLDTARRNRALLECVDELPEVYQSTLRLYYWMGFSIVEIASFIGVPENTVKSYLHRARQRLHEMLKERGFGGEITDV